MTKRLISGRLFHAKDRFETKLSEMPKLRTIIEHQSLTTTPTDGSEIQQANKGAMSTQVGVKFH